MKIKSKSIKQKTIKAIAKLTACILSAALIIGFSPVRAAQAATVADPETLILPGAFDAADEGMDSLKKQIASLEKIIELNVPRAVKIPVLAYHHLVRDAEMTASDRRNDFVLSVEQFSAQMKYLFDNKYYTASLSELEQFIAGKMILPERTVAITFDDGYRSNTKYAYPILKKYDFKAAIFVVTSLIGERMNVIERANWNDMKNCGDVFSYHSHSHNLHQQQKDGKSVFSTSDSLAITTDLLISKGMLSTSYIAYPYGQTNRAVKRALSDAGYRMGFTTTADYAKRKNDTQEIPRFTITPNIDTEHFAAICAGNAGTGSANGAEQEAA